MSSKNNEKIEDFKDYDRNKTIHNKLRYIHFSNKSNTDTFGYL